jgi:hypothetical protein
MSRILVVAATISAAWVAAFGLGQPVPRSPIHDRPLVVKFNNWPEPCVWIAVGGHEVRFVKVDLDFDYTSSPDWARFRLGLDDGAFSRTMREHVRQQRSRIAEELGPTEMEKSAWAAEVSHAMEPARLRQLFARYEKASHDATEVRVQDLLVWLLFLLMPPYLLLAVAFAMQSRTHASQMRNAPENVC